MFTYKINLQNHFKNAWTILIYVALAVAFPFYMVSRKGSSDLDIFILMSLVFLLIFLVPVLILHLNYYRINKNDILILDQMNNRMTLIRNGENHTFTFDSISKIERFKSHPLAENRTEWLPWDSYNHSIINLNDGSKFVITSLLVPNMDLPIDSSRIVLKKTWFKLAPKLNVF